MSFTSDEIAANVAESKRINDQFLERGQRLRAEQLEQAKASQTSNGRSIEVSLRESKARYSEALEEVNKQQVKIAQYEDQLAAAIAAGYQRMPEPVTAKAVGPVFAKPPKPEPTPDWAVAMQPNDGEQSTPQSTAPHCPHCGAVIASANQAFHKVTWGVGWCPIDHDKCLRAGRTELETLEAEVTRDNYLEAKRNEVKDERLMEANRY